MRRETPVIHGKKNEYLASIYFRCQHKTHHQRTMNVKENLQLNPSKRFKNTGCRFSLKIMLKKESSDARLELEYDHNHNVKALRATYDLKMVLSCFWDRRVPTTSK